MSRPAIQHVPALVTLVTQQLTLGLGAGESERVGTSGSFMPLPAMHAGGICINPAENARIVIGDLEDQGYLLKRTP